MFTRLKVAWNALLGRPIIYRFNLELSGGSIYHNGHHGPPHLAECTLTGPPAPRSTRVEVGEA